MLPNSRLLLVALLFSLAFAKAFAEVPEEERAGSKAASIGGRYFLGVRSNQQDRRDPPYVWRAIRSFVQAQKKQKKRERPLFLTTRFGKRSSNRIANNDNGENGMNLLCNLQPRLLGGIHCVQILEDGSIGSEISLMDEVTHKQISRSSFEEHY